jgi:hypothetical protein
MALGRITIEPEAQDPSRQNIRGANDLNRRPTDTNAGASFIPSMLPGMSMS